MTCRTRLSCTFKTIAFAAIVLAAAAGAAQAQPVFPGLDYQATGVFVDNDDNGVISCSDHVEFRARLGFAQGAPFPVLDGEFGATMLANGRVVVGSVTAVSEHPAGGPVVVTEGNNPGDINVRVSLGTVCPPGHCPPPPGLLDGATVTFFVQILEPNFGQLLTVPGFARGSNYAQRSAQPSIPYEECEPPTGPPGDEVDLFVDKSDGGITAPAGSVVPYTLVYGNDGSTAATGVVLGETVPAHAVFDAAGSSPGWSCADGAPPGTACTRAAGTLVPGGAAAAVFAVRIAATLPAGVNQTANTATIADDGASGPDANPADNTSTDTTPIAAAPDLAVTKSDGGASASPGAVVAYTLGYNNQGTQGATGVSLREVVPDHTAFEAAASSAGWSCANGAPAGTVCNRTIGALPVGSGGSATFAVRVAPALPPGVNQIVNTVTIADDGANGPDLDPSDNTATDTTPLEGAVPDLFVTKDDGGVTVGPGGTIAYDVVFGNAGTRGATNVVVADAVPPHTVFDGPGSSSRWSCSDGDPAGTVCTVELDGLSAGDTESVPMTVRVTTQVPPGVDEIVNTVTIADDGTNGPDADPSNNTATETTPVDAAPDLSIVKDDAGVTAAPGQVVAYGLGYANGGTQGATGVEITDTVPAHTVFAAGSSSAGWSCADGAPAGTVCTLGIGFLPVGGGGSATFAVRVAASLPPGVTEIVNTAVIADDGENGPDLDPSDNTATDSTPVEAAPDLGVDKDDGGLVAAPGQVVPYHLAYANAGSQGATGVVLSDVVPAHTVFDAAGSSAGWSCADGAPAGTACTQALGSLAAGAGGSATFAVRVAAALPPGVDEIVNVVTIADDGANGPDLDPSDNTDSDTTPLVLPPPGAPGLDAFKTDQPDRFPAEPGDAITYTVAVFNTGEELAEGVEFESGAPEHTSLVVGTVSTTQGSVLQGNAAGDTGVVVALGDLAPGEEAVVTFQVAIDPELPPEVTEIVCQGEATAEGLDPILTDDPDTPEVDDPTRTPVAQPGGPAPVEIPTAGPLGLALLVALLAALAVRRLRVRPTPA